ncbi:hypothetical protein [Roseateles chitosanitabidus]|uniref:hypothetical protein n=1 Tax=Roseateles chitosanitabidus TaxID=65048 RepID=UPI0014709CD6|nr:hypothetical protein [Roseateles chitosanitabidus]
MAAILLDVENVSGVRSESFIWRVEVPGSLLHHGLFKCEDIPCVCRVDESGFSVSVVAPLPQMKGPVEGWDRKQLELRAPAMGGSHVTFNCPGLISVKHLDGDRYQIRKLSFFVIGYPGWFPIVENEVWAEPVCQNTPEELEFLADIEAEIEMRRTKKKRWP